MPFREAFDARALRTTLVNPPDADLPIEERRTRRFIRRELWFVVATVLVLALVAWFAGRHATKQPARGAPLGELSSEPAHTPVQAPTRPPG